MHRRQNRDGVAIVLYAIAMFTIMLCMGLALDAGYLYTQKGMGQLTEDIIALIVLGSTDRALTHDQQIAYIEDQVNRLEAANGLPTPFYTRRTESNTEGDVVKLILNAPNPLKTMMMNLIGIGSVNVGLEAIAVRGFVIKKIDPNCPGNLGLFGCVRLQVQGNPLVDSYKSGLGSYASQAVNPGCGSSSGSGSHGEDDGGHDGGGSGSHSHLSHGGHGGHGESLYARRNLLGMSNRMVDLTGSFCYHGDTQSSLDTEVVGSGLVDGKVTTEYFDGDSDLITDGVVIEPVSDFNLIPAVGSASATSNDNGTISGGFDPDALLPPNFQLKQKGSNKEILLTAGKKYYFKEIDMAGASKLRIIGNPATAGPVEITLDGDAKFNGDITSDVQPTRPGWLKLTGINGCTQCCVGCQSSGVGHRGGHGHHDAMLPGLKRFLGQEPVQFGAAPSAPSGLQLLGTLGVMPNPDLPAWMQPGALNLADGGHGGGDDHGGGGGGSHDGHDDGLPGGHADGHYHHSEAGPCDDGPGHSNGSAHSIKFAGNSTVFMDIYAPGYNVNTNGVSQYHGRIMAEEIQLQGNIGFHYDEDLGGCVQVVESDTGDNAKVHLIN